MGRLRSLTWKPGVRRLAPTVGVLTFLLTGCADAKFLNRTCPMPRDPGSAAGTPAPDIRYRVACPDVLEITIADRPDWDAYSAIDVDGRLPLNGTSRPRVEGLTLDEVRSEVAKCAAVPPEQVQVSLAAPRSGQIFVNGPVRGKSRIVAYQGPEPVIDFLKRIGGLPPGSRLNQVYVIRAHVAAGQPPEVFRVNVEAVLIGNDQSTNVPLRASDQVYIGETRGSALSRSMPHWLGTSYRKVAGLLPDRWWPFDRP